MTSGGRLKLRNDNQILLEHVTWCSSFFCKFMGLMFRKSLNPGEGLLMAEGHASRINSSIHMLFMSFPIAAIWMDNEFIVVDKALAKPWRLVYIPVTPACFTLEASPGLLDIINIGDQLVLER